MIEIGLPEKHFENISYLRIEHYSGHPEVSAAANILVDHIASGMKFLKNRSGWTAAARKLVASLWIREEDRFRFGTKKDYFSAGKRKQVWLTPRSLKLFKATIELGWVIKTNDAVPPAYSKKKGNIGLAALYARQEPFKDLLRNLTEADIEVDRDLELVELRDDEGVLQPLPEKYLQSESYERTLETLNRHYKLLTDTNLRDKHDKLIHPMMVRYTRKWTGSTGIGGRFYSSFVNLPKEERLSFTIDGQPVGSWDFSQLHPTLLLLMQHGVGEEPNLFATGDVYDMPYYPDLPRSTNKTFINIIFNADSKNDAARAISTGNWYYDIVDDCWKVSVYPNVRTGVPIWPEEPLKSANNYIDNFLFRHPAFENMVFKGMWGTLQLIDSSIIEEAVSVCTEMGLPVLPVHDELVCAVGSKEKVKDILISSFHAVTEQRFSHFTPRINWSDS